MRVASMAARRRGNDLCRCEVMPDAKVIVLWFPYGSLRGRVVRVLWLAFGNTQGHRNISTDALVIFGSLLAWLHVHACLDLGAAVSVTLR